MKILRSPALWLAVPTIGLALLAAAVLFRPAAPAPMDFAPAADGTPYRLDLNDATAPELEALPGIGPVLAERILASRTELGRFETEADVLSVPGIGEATYKKIAPYITYGNEVSP